MNLIGWLASLSLFFLVLVKAVNFHQATLCRQEAWLKSTEFLTRTLLKKNRPFEQANLSHCEIRVIQSGAVRWIKKNEIHSFRIRLAGKL